jgi:phosphatidylglycerol phospholipase C
MLQRSLVGPLGARFRRRLKAEDRRLYVWTVNDPRWMRWSISKAVDGVITDDAGKFLQVCKDYELEEMMARKGEPLGRRKGADDGITLRMYADVAFTNVLTFVFGLLFALRYGNGNAKQLPRRIKIQGMSGAAA